MAELLDLELPLMETPGIDLLFHPDFEFTEEILDIWRDGIRENLELDLLRILSFGLDNREKLFAAVDAGSLPAKTLDFVPRVLFLMAELGMSDYVIGLIFSLQKAAGFERFVEADLGGAFWQVFYLLGRKDPVVIASFCYWDVNERVRADAVDALGQLAMHEPGWRDQVVQMMEGLVEKLLDSDSNESLVMTHVVMVLRDLRAESSLPLIQQADEAGLCIHAICGSIAEVEKRMKSSLLEFTKREVLDILSLYEAKKVAGTFGTLAAEENSSILNIRSGKPMNLKKPAKKRTGTIRPKTRSKYGKVGRNDPCPCGSGKKYKKCHGK